jgi:hypothetical protein
VSAALSIDYAARATAHRVAATTELRRLVRMVRQAERSRQYPVASWHMAFGALSARLRHESDYFLSLSHVRHP